MKRLRVVAGVVVRLALVGEQRGVVASTAGRRRASRSTAPSAAAARPGTTCPGRSAGSRRGRIRRAACAPARSRRPRLVGPSASVFHSAPSRSSTDTKVGSPPIVRRTSPRQQLRVDRVAERERSPAHCVVGVRLGDARRFVDARHLHVVRELDLALVDRAVRPAPRSTARGVQASGMWPSPASRPEVGSSPTQPAPGR